MTITVVELETRDARAESAWDEFVVAHPGSSFFHLSGWKTVIEQTTGHRCPFLVAKSGGEIMGILPLTFRKSRIFGNAAMSGYFGVIGHALALDSDSEMRLYDYAWRLAQSSGMKSLEIKFVGEPGELITNSWHMARDVHAYFAQPIAETDETRLINVPRKQRAVIRKSMTMGLTIETGSELIDQVYALYANSVHRLGTPVFPRKLFHSLNRVFGSDVEFLRVCDSKGSAVASLVSFYFKDRVMPYYAGSITRARALAAHDFMYFQLMERAWQQGYKIFDFGRSKINSGPYHYKKNWGFQPVPLVHAYRLSDGDASLPQGQEQSKYRLASNVWKKMPLAIANWVGPKLAKDLG